MCFSRRTLLVMLAFSTLCALGAKEASAQRRVSLVIGNSAYVNTTRLENPKNDAADLAETLKKLGFEVVEGRDLDKPAMERTIRTFAEKLAGAHVALFFYAGHGLQVSGQNYLVPVDARLASGAALDFEMVRLDLIQRTMEREASTNIIILDACRDNPLSRNLARALGTRSATIGKGLAAMESGEGTLISFSTQPGNVALDGTGRNSPFTAALLRHLPRPGEDLPTILINVRNDVMVATDRRQVPWEHSALTAKVYFVPPKPTGPTLEQQVEFSLWTSVKDTQNPAVLRTYVDSYPDGVFAKTARALIEHYEQQAKAADAERAETEKRREEARKTADLKRLEDERWGPQSKDGAAAPAAEERARAEARARDEQLRQALEDARVAREAARLAVEQRAAAMKEAEEARRKAAAVIQAERAASAAKDPQKLAALPDLPPPPTAAPASADNAELALRLNRELERVGCSPGIVGRSWTAAGQKALKRFSAITKRALHTDEPNQAALDAVSSYKSPVCVTRSEPRQVRSTSNRPAPARPKRCRMETGDECQKRTGFALVDCLGMLKEICK